MKKFLLLLAAFYGFATMSFSQTNYVATLQHEGNFSYYYGPSALVIAYNAAVNGDIITLSPGTFIVSSGTFKKGITIRGAGIEATEKTYIYTSSSVEFCSTDSTQVTTVEGVIFYGIQLYIRNNSSGNGQGVIKFIKCAFNSGINASNSDNYSSKSLAVRLYDCLLYGCTFFSQYAYPDYIFYNCYVENPYNYNKTSITTTTFVNCVINYYYHDYRYSADEAYFLNFFNCIFNWTGSYGGDHTNYVLPSTATCYNCLSINKKYLFSNLVSGGNNYTAGKASEVFVTYSATPQAGETFELKNIAKATYRGTDGTQIGMQGGNYPYTTTVQYPIITKFESSPQTTKEGILNIEVEVDGK